MQNSSRRRGPLNRTIDWLYITGVGREDSLGLLGNLQDIAVDGHFSFKGLPAGNYELRVSSDDRYTGWNVTQLVVSISPRASAKKIRIKVSLGI